MTANKDTWLLIAPLLVSFGWDSWWLIVKTTTQPRFAIETSILERALKFKKDWEITILNMCSDLIISWQIRLHSCLTAAVNCLTGLIHSHPCASSIETFVTVEVFHMVWMRIRGWPNLNQCSMKQEPACSCIWSVTNIIYLLNNTSHVIQESFH